MKKDINVMLTEVMRVIEPMSRNIMNHQKNVENGENVSQCTRSSGKLQARQKSGSKWTALLDTYFQHAESIFDTDVFSIVLSCNVPMLFQKYCIPSSCGMLTSIGKALMVIQFSLQSSDGKSKYREGIAKEHSELKFGVVSNTLYNVLRNSFGIFFEGEGYG